MEKLMQNIVGLDIKPEVFKVYLMLTDHSTTWSAWVDFRSNNEG